MLIEQGTRKLKNITPEEIEELLVLCRIPLEDVETVENAKEEYRNKCPPSLHPKYQATYAETGDVDKELGPRINLEYWYRCSYEYDEYDLKNIAIYMGDVITGYGPILWAKDSIEWFLKRGFQVWENWDESRESLSR